MTSELVESDESNEQVRTVVTCGKSTMSGQYFQVTYRIASYTDSEKSNLLQKTRNWQIRKPFSFASFAMNLSEQ